MSLRVIRADSEDLIGEVEKLRYRIYCEEKHLFRDSADHIDGRLRDGMDRFAHVWIAYEGDQAVGTIRLLWGAECDFDGSTEENFSLQPFVDVVGPARVAIYGRFMILPSHRATVVSALLLKAVSDFTIGQNIDVGFCDCEPHLVAFYEALGFRPYRSVYNDPEFGVKVPLVLIASDRQHLDRVESLFREFIPDSFRSEPEPELLDLLPRQNTSFTQSEAATAILRSFIQVDTDRSLVLRGITDAQLSDLCAKATTVKFTDGDVIIHQGHVSRTMWLILEGVLEVVVDGEVVGIRSAGDVVGELALLLDSDRSASVRGAGDGRAVGFSDRTISRLMEESPVLAAQFFFNLSAHLGSRILRETNNV